MSKTQLAAAGLVLLAVGFGLGRYSAAPRDSDSPPPIPDYVPPPRAAATPSRAAETEGVILTTLREPDLFARISALSTLLPTLGPEAVPEVREALENPPPDLSGEIGGAEIILLVRFWASYEPEAASRWAYLNSPHGHRAGALLSAFELWAKADPQAARAALGKLSLLPAQPSEVAQIALVRGWFESGRPGLGDYFRDLGVSMERQRAIATFARAAIRRDGPEALMRWAESLPDEDEILKLDAFRQVGAALTKADPAAGVAWCEAHCEGPFGTMIRTLVAQHWAARDGPAAMRWVSTAPAGNERKWAVKGALRGWRSHDREGLEEWMAAMGKEGVEPWFDPALELYVSWLFATSPAEAVEWAASITDEDLRERTLISLAQSWLNRDESEAEAWLEQSPLSPEARDRARSAAEAAPPGRPATPAPPAP